MIERIKVETGWLEIIVDVQSFTLNIGGYETNPMLSFPAIERELGVKLSVLKNMGIQIPKFAGSIIEQPKQLNAFISRHLGAAFNRRITAISYRFFVEPLDGLERYIRLNSSQRRFSIPLERLKALHRVKHIVKQAESDGAINLIPLIVQFERCPARLKVYFGKGLWRRLANASMAQNKRISWAVELMRSAKGKVDEGREIEETRVMVESMLSARAWIQRYWLESEYRDLKYLKWLELNAKSQVFTRKRNGLPYAKIRGISDESLQGLMLYSDGNSMIKTMRDQSCVAADNLADRIPKTLSSTKKWHDRIVKLMNDASLSKYSHERFTSTPINKKNESLELEVERGNKIKVDFLTSPFAIAKEGVEMRHCVASRISSVEEGHSIIAHLSSGGGMATAEWSTKVGRKWCLLEISGRFNDAPAPELVLAAQRVSEILKEQCG